MLVQQMNAENDRRAAAKLQTKQLASEERRTNTTAGANVKAAETVAQGQVKAASIQAEALAREQQLKLAEQRSAMIYGRVVSMDAALAEVKGTFAGLIPAIPPIGTDPNRPGADFPLMDVSPTARFRELLKDALTRKEANAQTLSKMNLHSLTNMNYEQTLHFVHQTMEDLKGILDKQRGIATNGDQAGGRAARWAVHYMLNPQQAVNAGIEATNTPGVNPGGVPGAFARLGSTAVETLTHPVAAATGDLKLPYASPKDVMEASLASTKWPANYRSLFMDIVKPSMEGREMSPDEIQSIQKRLHDEGPDVALLIGKAIGGFHDEYQKRYQEQANGGMFGDTFQQEGFRVLSQHMVQALQQFHTNFPSSLSDKVTEERYKHLDAIAPGLANAKTDKEAASVMGKFFISQFTGMSSSKVFRDSLLKNLRTADPEYWNDSVNVGRLWKSLDGVVSKIPADQLNKWGLHMSINRLRHGKRIDAEFDDLMGRMKNTGLSLALSKYSYVKLMKYQERIKDLETLNKMSDKPNPAITDAVNEARDSYGKALKDFQSQLSSRGLPTDPTELGEAARRASDQYQQELVDLNRKRLEDPNKVEQTARDIAGFVNTHRQGLGPQEQPQQPSPGTPSVEPPGQVSVSKPTGQSSFTASPGPAAAPGQPTTPKPAEIKLAVPMMSVNNEMPKITPSTSPTVEPPPIHPDTIKQLLEAGTAGGSPAVSPGPGG